MKVSLSWLGVILFTIIIVTFTYKGFCILNECPETLEGFQNDTQGIVLNSCPVVKDGVFPELQQIIDNNGNTVCKNTVTNGAVCTLSHKTSDLPTCDKFLLSYFQSKAETMCPASMPNYFERSDERGNRVRGCFAGLYNKEGNSPAVNSPKCNIYDDKKRDEIAMDSCSNIRMLDEVKCLPGTGIVTTKKLYKWNENIPPSVHCMYKNPTTGIGATCGEDVTSFKQHEYAAKIGILPRDWKDKYEYYNKIGWCQKQKMVEIDKSITFDDLKYVPIEPNATGPIYPPFTLERVKNSHIQNKGSKFCLDILGFSQRNGGALAPWDCNGAANQKFTYDSKERIVVAHSGKCLDVDGGSLRVQQWDCHDGPNQKWYHDAQGRIRTRLNNLCLKTIGAKGSQATVAFCGEGNDQKFQNA